jgi:hypothetical protein
VRFDVTRQDFEQGCATLFERALAPVTRLLGDLGEFTALAEAPIGMVQGLHRAEEEKPPFRHQTDGQNNAQRTAHPTWDLISPPLDGMCALLSNFCSSLVPRNV